MINRALKLWRIADLERREVLLHAGMAFVARVLGAVAAFSMSLVVARVLGAEESGYYFLGLTVVMVLAAVARMGLDNSVLRFTGAAMPAGEWRQVKETLSKSLALTGAVATLVAFALWGLADWLAHAVFDKSRMVAVLRAMAPGVIGLALFTLVATSLQGLRRVVASVFTLSIGVNLVLVLSLLILAKADAALAAGCYTLATLITLAVGGLCWWRSLGGGGAEGMPWKTLLASCLPLWIVMLMSQLIEWSGQFVAGAYVPPEQLAYLAVAQRTAMLTSFILVAVNLVVAPRFAALYKQNDQQGIQRLALFSVKLMVLFALPVIAVMLLFPGFLMGLFGDEFKAGAPLLQILAVGQFINVATGSVGYLLIMSGHEKDMRNTMLFCGPFAVVLAFTLTPQFGAVGSAAATAIAVATQNLIAVWLVKKRLGFNTLAVWRSPA